MRATRVANTFDFAFKFAEMAGANAVRDGSQSVAELPRLAPGANHGVEGEFRLAGSCRLLELKTLHYELHLIGHVMQERCSASQEKRSFMAQRIPWDKVSWPSNHEVRAFGARKKAGESPASLAGGHQNAIAKFGCLRRTDVTVEGSFNDSSIPEPVEGL